ncbi:MAG: flagellar biosynthetic protein FliO [Clostridia bacterium]|jgi:flagellar protein FliO/FliZ|nr:flagellar biosynthetic protein FliO [Clostridia bacterium]
METVLLLILFIAVLYGAYFASKYIGELQHKKFKNYNMKLIETLPVSVGKFLQLVKIGNSYFIIAVTKDDVRFIKEVDNGDVKTFNEYLKENGYEGDNGEK